MSELASRSNLFSIAPHAPFLPVLVDAVLNGTLFPDWPRNGPFWLTDITIVLPTRRARLGLAEAFLARGITLLPDIRTFGGPLGDEEPFLPPIDAPIPMPSIGGLERKLILAMLVEGWARTEEARETFSSPPNPAEILAMADRLCELIDDLIVEDVPIQNLRTLETEKDLAANWQQSLKFLDLALTAWPEILHGRGKAEATSLRNQRLDRQSEAAPLIYGDRPVIAAGTTGSVPATARLLQAIARLPRGAVVLPGFDTTLAPTELEALLDPKTAPHAHPQYGLTQLVRRLNGFGRVTELAPKTSLRSQVVRRALALPASTASWPTDRAAIAADDLAAALDGVSILAARNEGEQACAIAIAAREALSQSKNVGIVTPDRNLARRIVAELGRHGIEVDDAAGAPLFQSPTGRLCRQMLAVCTTNFAPVDLMALLRNRATRLGLSRVDVSRLGETVELGLLRGQRLAPGPDGLRRAAANNFARVTKHAPRRLSETDLAAVNALIDRLQNALDPLCKLLDREAFSPAEFVAALGTSMAALVAPALDEKPVDLPGLAEFWRWQVDMAARPEGPALGRIAIEGALYALMTGVAVRNPQPRRDDIAIWGQLEARLQSPDLMILAGLNEDVWPEPADPGPWLSRGMRLAVGLEPPERNQGLAAHDFELALGNPRVVVAYAERLGTSPALPSRLVQRLEAFIGEDAAKTLHRSSAAWLAAARAIDAAGDAVPAQRPQPSPPSSQRPRTLSITEIETLFRSPYDIYAKHVLRLRPLDPLGEEPGARERGSMIHDVFGTFIIEGGDVFSHDALERLKALAAKQFEGLDAIAERRDIWLRRFATAAEAFLEFERGRDAQVTARHAEISGDWALPFGFHLIGRADRIDVLADGSLQLIDFKTGTVPDGRTMKAFHAPQLLLEAAMARHGAFPAVPAVSASALTYIKIGQGPDAFVPSEFRLADGFTLMSAAEEVTLRMQRHVDTFLLQDRVPMAARILPDLSRTWRGTYDHLARTDEWALMVGDDSP